MVIITTTGNLGADAEAKQINGKTYISMNVGCRMRKDTTLWVNVLTSYNERLMPYLKKGQSIMISGEADIKGFSRKDGGVGVDVSMFAYSLQLVGRAENGQQATETERLNNYQPQPQQTQHGANTGQITDESNLPF